MVVVAVVGLTVVVVALTVVAVVGLTFFGTGIITSSAFAVNVLVVVLLV